jgi:hypothetical protein
MTGFLPAELTVFEHKMHTYIIHTTNLGKRMVRKARYATWTIAPALHLLVTLVWLRLYDPFWFLASYFQLNVSYIIKIVKRCTAALAFALDALPPADGGLDIDEDSDDMKFATQVHGIGRSGAFGDKTARRRRTPKRRKARGAD